MIIRFKPVTDLFILISTTHQTLFEDEIRYVNVNHRYFIRIEFLQNGFHAKRIQHDDRNAGIIILILTKP